MPSQAHPDHMLVANAPRRDGVSPSLGSVSRITNQTPCSSIFSSCGPGVPGAPKFGKGHLHAPIANHISPVQLLSICGAITIKASLSSATNAKQSSVPKIIDSRSPLPVSNPSCGNATTARQ